jgi:hypothetical protein
MRIFTLILTLSVYASTYGQQISPTVTSKMPAHHGHGNSNGTRQVVAVFNSTNFYVPGTTMDLTFTMELTNTDAEYGDSLALTFPAAITPNGSTTDPIYLATEGQGSEALNGVSGQTISWGDNDNSYGGIEPGNLIPFVVNVTIDSGATGQQAVNVHISGDQFGPNPQDFNGVVLVDPLPNVPNAILSSTDLFEALTPVSVSDTSQTYTLSNNGGDTLDIDSVIFVNGGGEITSTLAAGTIAPGDSMDFFFTYIPTDLLDDVDTFDIYTNDGNFSIPMAGYAYGNGQEFEGFEGTSFFPSCQWGNNDADGDGVPWFAYGPSPHTGNASAASASWLGGSVLTPDNWLISPQVTPTATNNFLSWFAAAQDPDFPSDFYEVYVSTTGDDPADFTTSLFSETLVDDVWRVRRIDLSAYIGQNVYLAFRHHNSVDQFIMKIDDVRYPSKTTADTNLPPLTLNLNHIPTTCPSDTNGALLATISGGGSLFAYTFAGLDTFASIDTSAIVQALPTGSYFVSVEDHCGFVATDTIDILSANPLDDATFQYPVDTICQNNPTNASPVISGLAGGSFTAGPGLVFANLNTGEVDLLNSLAGTYQVTYNTNGPCPNTATRTITLAQSDDASFQYPVDSACENSAVNLSAVISGLAGGTFSADAGLEFADINTGEVDVLNSPAGIYQVSYTTNGACPSTATATINIDPLDDASFQFPADTICQNDSVNVGPVISGLAGGTFSSDAGLEFADINTGEVDVLNSQAGSYQVLYTTNGPCPNTDTVTIVVEAKCATTGVDPLADQGLSVYPNPNQGSFFLYNSGNRREAHIKVYNLQGQVVYRHSRFLMQGERHAIHMGDVAPGMYLIEVSSEGQTGIDRLLVQ